MKALSTRNICLAVVVVAAFVFNATVIQAQTWVGSTGTVDPNSTNLIKYIDGKVELRNDAPVGATAFIRYNVLPVRDLATDLQSIEFRVFAARFLDNGTGHVFLSLKQLNLSTGAITVLLTFDSNASSPSASYQEANTPGNPTFNFTFADSEGFNPTDSVYYVEAQLSRTAAGGQAGLAGFSIKKIVP
ncbi:MAG TPA: hypothetical protein VKH81_11700 [Candidatus Angelobacter sp.]|nr:hypothetical protein [Candidatus Angelobacter sp.]